MALCAHDVLDLKEEGLQRMCKDVVVCAYVCVCVCGLVVCAHNILKPKEEGLQQKCKLDGQARTLRSWTVRAYDVLDPEEEGLHQKCELGG